MSHNEMRPNDALQIAWTDAGHPDEGSLQTWLDDAFDAANGAQVQAHVGGCAVCQQEVATLRGYTAAASRILGALDDAPGGVVSRAETAKAAAVIVAQADGRTRAAQKAATAWYTRPAFRVAAALALIAGGTSWVMSRSPATADTTEVATADGASTGTPAVESPAAQAPATAASTSQPLAGVAPEQAKVATATAPTASPPMVSNGKTADVAAPVAAKMVVAVEPMAQARKATARIDSASPANVSDPVVSGRAMATMASSVEPLVAPGPRTVIVRGTVRDASTQRPIGGVQVQATVTGSNAPTSGTLTSTSGTYSLAIAGVAPNISIRVTFRRIGYTQSIATRTVVGDTLIIDHAMVTSVLALSEVIVRTEAANGRRAPLAGLSPTFTAASQSQDVSGRGVAGGIARGVARTSPTRLPTRSAPRRANGGNREQYDKLDDNPFLAVSVNPRSTFSVAVDRASYSNVRRVISQGQTPPPDAVRIEELINYFPYDLAEPRGDAPVSITTETMAAPWQPKHRLVRVALQARRIETAALPPS
ncbi:von Willebrand factor type A domain-containing protein, partial [Gemmatimonas sp.]|uniref:VWA domain-containing protein n=1 Tax=Gemmatimonas sp. TaxID=1962908 RepID=UPI003566AAA2